jgi:predicted GNAT family N-acyltransferase
MIQDYINKNYGDYLEQFYIYENKDSLKLSAIVLNKEKREAGIGTKIMTDVINYADKSNKIIVLTPSSDYGGTKQRLIKFYRSFGFVMNRAHNKDFRFKDTMIRYPKGMNENKIKGGLADNKSVKDIANKHDVSVDDIKDEIEKGVEVEKEHTSDDGIAHEIAKDHTYEDDKYYEKLADIEESKTIIKKLLKEEIDLQITDESPDTISILVQYNDRNAGIIMVTPANAEDTLEIVAVKFKKDYETLHILDEAIKSLWDLFKDTKSIIVAPEAEGIAFWNKLGFSRISPNYLIHNRGH